ncbi:MAG TPA: Ldh family oxidoreductase [Tepidisphaeraceae bacterium]|nr:Ldh family oxidoreductase [Tepidisphaeraceae bacterium]
MANRYSATELTTFATQLLAKAGLDADKSRTVAEILVEGDLLGHTTHGLQLLRPYLDALQKGTMTKTGDPRVIADYPAAITWDGQRLPGPWLVVRAIDLTIQRAKVNGSCCVAIRRSHHIACLAAYLKRVTDQKLMIILSCSDPSQGTVAPHGGIQPLYTPDPIAAAWPTDGQPVMIDISMSITTNGLTNRLHKEGGKLPGKWLIDSNGRLSDDPAVLFQKPPGALLPIGGLDHGHKGYALGLLVEAMTSGLAGFGRADPTEGWGASVFLQIFDPALFGGTEEFTRQAQWMADACRKNQPREGFERVRLPGEAGLKRREDQLKNGVELHPGIMPVLQEWGKKLGVNCP